MPILNRGANIYVTPSLLDRLTVPEGDEELRGAYRPGDAKHGPGIRAEEFQDTILRDLEWLFNAVSPLDHMDDGELLRKYPRTASSILSYGLRGILGRVVHDPAEIEKHVEAALAAFEPRMIVEDISLKITREGQLIEIEIQGLLLTQHSRRRLWIRTDLHNLDSRLKTDSNG